LGEEEGGSVRVDLMGRAVEFPERIPPSIGCLRTSALAGVQIRAARRAEPFAIVAAQGETRRGQHPLLSNRRSQIEVENSGVEPIDVGIVGFFVRRFSKNEVRLVSHVRARIGKTSPAWDAHVAFDSGVPIKTSQPARRRQAARDVYAALGPGVIGLPDRIVGRQFIVDLHGVRSEGPNVKGQHP
jgi:hypothetical protein